MKSALILCAGQSERFQKPKMFECVNGKTVVETVVEKFLPYADEIVVVCKEEDFLRLSEMLRDRVRLVTGGATRTESVRRGLKQLSANSTYVAIHDGARPFVSERLVETAFREAERYGCAVPCVSPTDSVYDKTRGEKIERERLMLLQTPQTFDTQKLRTAYDEVFGTFTDDSEVFAKKYPLHFIEGERTNRKITYPTDLGKSVIGNGFDVHPLVEGRPLRLGGVCIPFSKGLLGHSDADVLVHAVMDAVLSAAGEADIGHQFPDTDERYRNADSMELFRQVRQKTQRLHIHGISCVVAAEQPKLAPYLDEMRKNLASTANVPTECVNISATTTEKLGIVGKGKGIAAYAVCLGELLPV